MKFVSQQLDVFLRSLSEHSGFAANEQLLRILVLANACAVQNDCLLYFFSRLICVVLQRHSVSTELVQYLTDHSQWRQIETLVLEATGSLSLRKYAAHEKPIAWLTRYATKFYMLRCACYRNTSVSIAAGAQRPLLDVDFSTAVMLAGSAGDIEIIRHLAEQMHSGPGFTGRLNEMVAEVGNPLIWKTIYGVVRPTAS